MSEWGLRNQNAGIYVLNYTETVSEAIYGEEASSTFGEGEGQIWLDDVKCTGTENNIWSCPQLPLEGTNNCLHSEDSGIRCSSNSCQYINVEMHV